MRNSWSFYFFPSWPPTCIFGCPEQPCRCLTIFGWWLHRFAHLDDDPDWVSYRGRIGWCVRNFGTRGQNDRWLNCIDDIGEINLEVWFVVLPQLVRVSSCSIHRSSMRWPTWISSGRWGIANHVLWGFPKMEVSNSWCFLRENLKNPVWNGG